MDKFKFALFSVVVLGLVAVLGYWAFTSIETGSEHVSRQKLKDLQRENKDLQTEVEDLKDKLADSESKMEDLTPKAPTQSVPEVTPTYKYQTLINELQKLISGGINMKLKSRGTRVGTIQNFLNIYFNTSKKVDNDYGKTTKADVANFQKAVGLPVTGETNPAVYQKMIDWLKNQ